MRQPRRARPTGGAGAARAHAWRDVAVAVAVTAVATVLLVRAQVPDGVVEWWDGAPRGPASVLVAILVILPLALGALALWRWREARSLADDLATVAALDPVTGLPGRHVLVSRLGHLGETSGAASTPAAVVVLLGELDTLQQRLGWSTADEVLAATARRLTATTRAGDLVGRVGATELAVVCSVTGSGEIETVARRVARALDEPLDAGGDQIRLEASVGATGGRLLARDPASMLAEAGAAARAAREGGGDRVVVLAPGTVATGRRAEELRLAQAFERDEFRLFFQPVVRSGDGHVAGVEALIRWQHPERGIVPPGAFIPMLEESGLIIQVGAWVLREACCQVRALDGRQDGPPLRVAVNVSPRQIADGDLQAAVTDALRVSGLPPERLTLEITEGALVADPGLAWAHLREARRLGVHLALDDFGTGWSSLSFVRRFVIDQLKIDRSFVSGLEINPEDRAIVGAVLGIAQALDIPCVAEGVETAGQADTLRTMGCPLLQGFHFGRPAPLEQALGITVA